MDDQNRTADSSIQEMMLQMNMNAPEYPEARLEQFQTFELRNVPSQRILVVNMETALPSDKCPDDGFAWRKYGTKPRLNLDFEEFSSVTGDLPRLKCDYFRCKDSIHYNQEDGTWCSATKKVIRVADPTINELNKSYRVEYTGIHNHPAPFPALLPEISRAPPSNSMNASAMMNSSFQELYSFMENESIPNQQSDNAFMASKYLNFDQEIAMSSSYESTSYFSEMKTPNEGFLSRENTPPVTPRSYDQPPLQSSPSPSPSELWNHEMPYMIGNQDLFLPNSNGRLLPCGNSTEFAAAASIPSIAAHMNTANLDYQVDTADDDFDWGFCLNMECDE